MHVKDAAIRFDVTNAATLYEWIRVFRCQGVVGLMSKRERIEAGVYKTTAQLDKDLPDNVAELKKLAASIAC